MQAERMATFCLLTGQPPSVYYDLTLRERNAFVKVSNRARKRRKG